MKVYRVNDRDYLIHADILSCQSNQSQILDQSKMPCSCRNGGTCFWSTITDYRCYCPEGFTGVDCLDRIDHCSSQPCYNHGTCQSQSNGFTCQCSTNYRGIVCEQYVDPCESNPCTNNGTCQRDGDHYRCQCSSALFTGEHCHISRTACASQPCRNQGQCLNVNQTFSCRCSFDYRGIYCEQPIDLCRTTSNTSLCLNGGQCRISNHTIQCSCLAGFTGLFCESNIDDCYTRPCSPHGECLDLINGYQCQCHANWYGYNCDRQQKDMGKLLINRSNFFTVFQLRNSSLNISKCFVNRRQIVPVRIQYEFRTTLNRVSLLAIGEQFQQELIDNRLVTRFNGRIRLSTSIEQNELWTSMTIEFNHLWIDIRLGKNALAQRFYIEMPLNQRDIDQQIIFGFRNYSGCVRQIEVTLSATDSIVYTDQFVDINEYRQIGCER
jgi:hypothetical protein